MSTAPVTVVVPVYGGLAYTARCLGVEAGAILRRVVAPALLPAAPMALAASTYSFSFTDRPRPSRARVGVAPG